jgi:hypothetical protein
MLPVTYPDPPSPDKYQCALQLRGPGQAPSLHFFVLLLSCIDTTTFWQFCCFFPEPFVLCVADFEIEKISGQMSYTATKIPFMYSLFCELRGLSPNSHIHVSVSDLYIPRIGPHISCSRKGRSIMGLYKSLTDTCGNWDFGRAMPFLGIFVSNFRYWFFAV